MSTNRTKYFHNGKVTVGLGNKKLDNSIMIFNLPAIKTCPNCSMCAPTCYALKAERLYPRVKACREANLTASKDSTFIARMVELITREKAHVVRVHESGDFYSQEYADKWTEIAKRLPHVNFYAYTKSPYRPSADNINIVESILPDGSLNYGKLEFIMGQASKLNAFICPCKPKERAKLCGTTCTRCQTEKYVLFLEH